MARKHVDRQIRLFPSGDLVGPNGKQSPPEESHDAWDAVMRDLGVLLRVGRFEFYLARQRPGDED